MNLKNKVLKDIEIEGIAAEGKCITRYEGAVIFVTGVAPGDVADIKIIRKKKTFLEAIPLAIKKYSDKRQEPFCNHFGTCGGCKWQHISYDTQLAYKHQQVVDSLERIAKVPIPKVAAIIPSVETRYYRNKLEFTFSNKKWLTRDEIDSGNEDMQRNTLGFHIPKRFDKILEIEHCYLQPDPSNAIRIAVKDIALQHDITFFDLVTQVGFLRNLIIRTSVKGEIMVILQVAGHENKWLELVLNHIKAEFPNVSSLNYVINTKGNDTFHDLDVVNWHGQPYIEEEMPLPDNPAQVVKFRVGPKSFFQTNSMQANVLYKKAWELAGLTGSELVYDLYTGTGTIANYIAHNAKKVIGIEYIDAAIEDAKVNSEINGISNTAFFAGDMKDLLNEKFTKIHGKPDVIITDPPRAGMHPDVCHVLLKTGAQKIVYVSCNPATQARDIAILDEKYKVTAVQPVDMFPHTHHVENIVLLELK